MLIALVPAVLYTVRVDDITRLSDYYYYYWLLAAIL